MEPRKPQLFVVPRDPYCMQVLEALSISHQHNKSIDVINLAEIPPQSWPRQLRKVPTLVVPLTREVLEGVHAIVTKYLNRPGMREDPAPTAQRGSGAGSGSMFAAENDEPAVPPVQEPLTPIGVGVTTFQQPPISTGNLDTPQFSTRKDIPQQMSVNALLEERENELRQFKEQAQQGAPPASNLQPTWSLHPG